MKINGEAIYDTHNWINFGEGGNGGSTKIRFTVKGDVLYAIIVGKWPGASVLLTTLSESGNVLGEVTSVTMLGSKEELTFFRDKDGLKINLPNVPPCNNAYTLKIRGLKMNPPTWTKSGNPITPN